LWKYFVPAIPTFAAIALVAILIEENEANVAAFLSVGGILGSSIATGIVPSLMYQRVIQHTGEPVVPALHLFRRSTALIGSSVFFSVVLLSYGILVWHSLPIQILACVIAGANLFYVYNTMRR
jgi:hypothetical protein